MKIIRVALALLLATASIQMIVRVMVPRVTCNRAKGEMNRELRRRGRDGAEYERNLRARRNLKRCEECLAIFPEDYQLHLLRAANLQTLGRLDDAVATYRHALTLTERPEIYAQMGAAEIERGNIEAGRRALVQAATYNILYVMTVDEPLRDEIYQEVDARRARLLAAAKR
jgi:Tfp pilus assembly protein PilF